MADFGSIGVIATSATTERTLATRFAEITNVKDYGAAGDGSTDDTTALQAAIDAAPEGGVVFIPSGIYKVTDELVVEDRLGLTIQGTGNSYRPNPAESGFDATTVCSQIRYEGSDTTDSVFRIKGSQRCVFNDLVVSADAQADAGFTLESSSGGFAVMSAHSFNRVHVHGKYLLDNNVAYFVYGWRMSSPTAANNEHHMWVDCEATGCTYGWSIEHSQSKEHVLVGCNAHVPMDVAVRCVSGGFGWYGGTAGAMSEAVIEIENVSEGCVIMNVRSELAKRFLKMTNSSTTTNPCDVSLIGCAHTPDPSTSELDYIQWIFAGPLLIHNFKLHGIQAADERGYYISLNVHSFPSGEGPMCADIRNCQFFTTHQTGLVVTKPHATFDNAICYEGNLRVDLSTPAFDSMPILVDPTVTPEFFA